MKTFTKIAHYLGLSACALYMLVGIVCKCTAGPNLKDLLENNEHTFEEDYARWVYWTFFGGCWAFVHYFITPLIMAVLIAMHVFELITAKWYKILLIILLAIWVLWMHGPATAFFQIQLAQSEQPAQIREKHIAALKVIGANVGNMWFTILTVWVAVIFLHLNLWSLVCCDVCTKDEDQEELDAVYGEEP